MVRTGGPPEALHSMTGIPKSTRWHRTHGRPSLKNKSNNQQYLTIDEEKLLVECLLSMHRDKYVLPVKYMGEIAFRIRRLRYSLLLSPQQDVEPKKIRHPNSNWPKDFQKRHEELRYVWEMSTRKRPSDKLLSKNMKILFERIEPRLLYETKTLAENTYQVSLSGVPLSFPEVVKELVDEDAIRNFAKISKKGTMITAIECTSRGGQVLHPTLIWPEQTHEQCWAAHNIPEWHHWLSTYGYLDCKIAFKWVKDIFEPCTVARADGRLRVLISETLSIFGSLEMSIFCSEHNIRLFRYHSLPGEVFQMHSFVSFDQLGIKFHEEYLRMRHDSVHSPTRSHFPHIYDIARQEVFKLHALPSAQCISFSTTSSSGRIETNGPRSQFLDQNTPDLATGEQISKLRDLRCIPQIADEVVSLREDVQNHETFEILSEDTKARIIKIAHVAEMALRDPALLLLSIQIQEDYQATGSTIDSNSWQDIGHD